MTPVTVLDLDEVQSRFDELLDRVERGEEIVIARAGRPVAELVPCRPDQISGSTQEHKLQIVRLGPGDDERVQQASHLFDDPPRGDATGRFLDDPNHHLFIAYADGAPAGFVSGVEVTHPDKGTEMFLYELGVDERFRRRGIGRALTETLAALARERGCVGMFVLTEPDNAAALATYEAAGAARAEDASVMLEWELPGG